MSNADVWTEFLWYVCYPALAVFVVVAAYGEIVEYRRRRRLLRKWRVKR